ncbi:bifunctional hydroxymethylpyrimidine kinase/phosphomethylpyrimidine kinase [Candidatus Pyrohabitans sp.]
MKNITCLTIAGSDSGGGAGIQADTKTFTALGVHGVSVITSVTAQNTQRVEDVFNLPLSFVKRQLEAVHRDFEIKAAKTGMLATEEMIKLVAENMGDYPLVVDPVMVATSGDRLQESSAVEALKRYLLPKAKLVTPNIQEAEVLSGIKIGTLEDAKDAALAIAENAKAVLVKGGHLKGIDVLYHEGEFYEFSAHYHEGRYHGTGCTYSSAIAAYLAMEFELKEAVKKAKEYIADAIEDAYSPGKGAKVLNQVVSLEREAERYAVLTDLEAAVEEVVNLPGFHRLIPEVGINFVYSLPHPRDAGDVAGIRGRIVNAAGKAVIAGCIGFTASQHVSRVLLAASQRDRSTRSAMNIRYSLETLRAVKNSELKVASFSREEEPSGVSSMEWGTRRAIEEYGGVPDAIYDEGAVGKEPMIRLLGRNPQDIVLKVRRILENMHR